MTKWIPFIVSLLLLAGCVNAPPRLQTKDPTSDPGAINLQLGVGYIQTGRFDVAAEKLKKALEYDNSLVEAHNALAILYEETGEKRLADQEYQQAIQKDPGYTLARMNYGRFLCANGKANEGEGQFLLAAADPEIDNPDRAFIGAGVCARVLGVSDRAEGYFRQALELNPFSPGALLEMASLYHAQGNQLQARDFLQRYHKQAGYSSPSLGLGIAIEKAIGDGGLQREYERLLLSQFADSNEARRLNESE